MKFARISVAAVAGALLLAGCATKSPETLATQVHEWVPVGTTRKTAERTMTGKGYECTFLTRTNRFNRFQFDVLDCEKVNVETHTFEVEFIIEDGKVTRYGSITVDDVEAK